ncbi:MAG: aminotransferase class IV [Aureliella sp.]
MTDPKGIEPPPHVGWQASRWVTPNELSLPLEDFGVLQGVSVVDRIRTASGRLVDLDWHLERFEAGADALGIHLIAMDELRHLCTECVKRRSALLEQNHTDGEDFALVLFATPGSVHSTNINRDANLMLHTADLPAQRLSHFYRHGQDLVVVPREVVPQSIWSPQIKTRCRLHYYLAETEARQSVPGAGAVLSTCHGDLGDTSISNLLVVKANTIYTPPSSEVLHGITLRRILQLAEEESLKVVTQPIPQDFALNADELLCTGTSALLWPARTLTTLEPVRQQREWSTPHNAPIYRQLCKLISKWLSYDYQADFITPRT